MGSLQMQYNRGRQAVITNELCVLSFYYYRFALHERDTTGELTACIPFFSLPPRSPLLLSALATLFSSTPSQSSLLFCDVQHRRTFLCPSLLLSCPQSRSLTSSSHLSTKNRSSLEPPPSKSESKPKPFFLCAFALVLGRVECVGGRGGAFLGGRIL